MRMHQATAPFAELYYPYCFSDSPYGNHLPRLDRKLHIGNLLPAVQPDFCFGNARYGNGCYGSLT